MAFYVPRRALLQAALSSLVVGPWFGCRNEAPFAGTLSPMLGMTKRYFPDGGLAEAAFLGSRYLMAVAPNASEDEIRTLVAPTTALLAASDDPDSDFALDALQAKVCGDFANDATVLVDGWHFSVTEMHLCVLAGQLVPFG
jgi:hypothetical protein